MDPLEQDALYFDYASAANPLFQKIITPIPLSIVFVLIL